MKAPAAIALCEPSTSRLNAPDCHGAGSRRVPRCNQSRHAYREGATTHSSSDDAFEAHDAVLLEQAAITSRPATARPASASGQRRRHGTACRDCWFPCVGTLWTPAPEASAPTRSGSTLPMRMHDRPALDASPAFGDERVSDETVPHNRIRHGRPAAAGLRLGDRALVPRAIRSGPTPHHWIVADAMAQISRLVMPKRS